MRKKTESIGFSCTPEEKEIFIELYNKSSCRNMSDFFNSVNREKYTLMKQGKRNIVLDSRGKRFTHKERNTLKKLQKMWAGE